MHYEQLLLFDPTVVSVLDPRPGEVWVRCRQCREDLLRTRLKANISRRCPFCGGPVEVHLDGGPKPRRKRESRTQVRGEGVPVSDRTGPAL
jgi:hypothetical protein